MTLQFFANGNLVQELMLTSTMQPKTIGRGQADIRFSVGTISQKQAVVFAQNGKFYIRDEGSANGTYVNNILIKPGEAIELKTNTFLHFASPNYQAFISRQSNEDREEQGSRSLSATLETKSSIIIGRNQENDIVLTDVQVSRNHARIRKADNRYYVKDLGSKNGTFIGGRKITGEQELFAGDQILIGTTKFSLNQPSKNIRNETAIRIVNLSKIFPSGKYGFHELSCNIKSKTIVGIMGPSGCGKSTLLNVLTGNLSYKTGHVLVHGLELRKHINYLKHHIGYVPQYDILHQELSVRDALWFTAKLRIETMEEKEFFEKALHILTRLQIQDVFNQSIHSLSGGQRKRVCIALELINDPLILFLDEPTSPLDPQSAQELMVILNELTATGTTIVMVTHKPDDTAYLNKIFFLGKEGWPLFFGNNNDYLNWFGVKETVNVYTLLNSPQSTPFLQLSEKFNKQHVSHEKITEDNSDYGKLKKKAFSPYLQFYWLVKRTIRIKMNNTGGSLLLLLQAPIIAGLICAIFSSITLSVLFLLAISSIWLGVSNAAREIVGELNVYRRERMYNLSIGTYLFSKIFIFALIGFFQSALFTFIIWMRYMQKEQELTLVSPGYILLITLILNLVASLLGLLVSAVAKNNEQVVGIVPLLLIPQILLAGILTKINNYFVELLSYVTLSRWGTEAFTNAQPKVENITKQIVDSKTDLISRYHPDYSSKDLFGSATATPALEITALTVLSTIFIVVMIYAMRAKDKV